MLSLRRSAGRYSATAAWRHVVYGADVLLSVLIPEERAGLFAAHLLDVSAGTIEALEAGERFQDVPWREPVRRDG